MISNRSNKLNVAVSYVLQFAIVVLGALVIPVGAIAQTQGNGADRWAAQANERSLPPAVVFRIDLQDNPESEIQPPTDRDSALDLDATDELGESPSQRDRNRNMRSESVAGESDSTTELTPDDGYRIPKVRDVREPIALAPLSNIRQHDPNDLLSKRQVELTSAERVSYSLLSGTMPRPAIATWAAPDFYHRPLLFEETNLERYGNRLSECLPMQNIASAAHFFSRLPVLPYQLGNVPPCNRDYTLRHYRPGNCVPYQRETIHGDAGGAFWQTLATAAVVLP